MYRLMIVQEGDDSWAKEVVDEVRREMAATAVPTDLLRVVDHLDPDAVGPAVVVFLGSTDAARMPDASVQALLEAGHPVIPLHRSERDVPAVMPVPLRPINAVDWTTDTHRGSRTILRALGLSERDRRIFISYRRTDTGGLAEQLHTHLIRRGFDVFLDRYSVEAGADFQRRIHIDLADKAFVLLLESWNARSRWVEEEVAYAMSHRLAHLVLTMPFVRRSQRFPSVDEAFRHRLSMRDLSPNIIGGLRLSSSALSRVLDLVEVRYAALMRRRHEQIVGSITTLFADKGFDVAPTADWGVIARPPPGRGPTRVFVSSVRAPDVRDLRVLDALCEPLRKTRPPTVVDARLVHPAEDVDPDDASLVSWAGAPFELTTMLLRELIDDG
jgi:hypothetical protein